MCLPCISVIKLTQQTNIAWVNGLVYDEDFVFRMSKGKPEER